MKKQLLTIAMVTMLLVATLISTVSASTIKASAKEVKAGETITVTVKTDSKLASGTIKVKYDTSKFAIEKKDITANGNANLTANVNDGKAIASLLKLDATADATTDEITFVFTALEDTEAGDATFELVEFSGSATESTATFPDGTSVNVSVLAKEAQPTTKPTNKPTDKVTPTDKVNPTKTPTGKPGTLVQTGAPVYVAGIAAVVVAAFVLMVRKAK